MTDNFPKSLEWVFKHEGILSDDPADHGGVTKYGISIRFLKLAKEDINGDGHVNSEDILGLTMADASLLYRKHFWDHYRCDEIVSLSLSAKMFDCLVNMRGKTASRIFQRSLNHFDYNVAVDGMIGSKTILAMNAIMADGKEVSDQYLEKCCKYQLQTYMKIIENDPTQIRFVNGWTARANDLIQAL
jgi:lysozyme family protein